MCIVHKYIRTLYWNEYLNVYKHKINGYQQQPVSYRTINVNVMVNESILCETYNLYNAVKILGICMFRTLKDTYDFQENHSKPC